MMAEDLNLPASLERLEINPERLDCNKTEQPNPFVVGESRINNDSPECSLKSLSLKAECNKGNCQCNKKRNKESVYKKVSFKRAILRRSKLNPTVLLRAPLLKINQDPSTTINNNTEENRILLPTPSNSIDSLTREAPSPNLSRVSLPAVCSVSLGKPSAVGGPGQSNSASCSLQARTAGSSAPDDTTIDELASYFDLMVHIPKKMSLMAEMMYI